MITLLTGFPGNGKTLYLLNWILKWSKAENRPVYYSGIELTDQGKAGPFADWIEFQPMEWNKCPPGAIIVTDECQRIYRNRSINATAPKFVTDLETHRHLGVDLVYVTQHPMLVDPALRRLTGQHLHCVRTFGMEGSVVHEWPQVRENCDKPVGRKDSVAKPFKFDKSLYGMYKSAEQHTMKRNLPWKVKMLFVLPVILAVLVYMFYGSMMKRIHPEGVIPAQQTGIVSQSRPAGGGGKTSEIDPIADAKKYAFETTPRYVGLAHTAPKYDAVTAPVTAPVPASCIASKTKCSCYSQQATVMAVPDVLCRSIVERGFFVDFKDRPDVQQSQHVLNRPDGLPLSGANTRDIEPRMIADRSLVASATSSSAEDGYGELGKRGAGVRRRVAEHNALTN